MLVVWTVVVLITAVYHEMWRDEVRALSYAMDSSSLLDLWRSMENEGHPILWYLLLYGGYHLTSSTLTLPVLSVCIAGLAVLLFTFYSPLPPWLKVMFVFSGLPLYEYSVMARNYGISMLLFFAFALMYVVRKQNLIVLGIILALLANTNVHSLILTGLLLGLWVWDIMVEDRTTHLTGMSQVMAALAIAVIGIAIALYTVWPTEDTIASDTTRYSMRNMVSALVATFLRPSNEFRELFPAFVPASLSSIILLASILGLIVRPLVLAIAFLGFCTLSIFFIVFYPGAYRHQGLFVVFLISLYWIVCNHRGRPFHHVRLENIFRVGLYGALPALFAGLFLTGGAKVYKDVRYQKSAGQAFYTFLKSHPEYADAILIGEPDYYLESVHYYTDNRIYIVRERRFGNTVRFVRRAQQNLSLGELLCLAWYIQQRENKPVLIAMGHPSVDHEPWSSTAPLQSINYSFGRTFTWSKEELENWKTYATLQRHFAEQVIGDEAYSVYSVTIPTKGSEPMCRSRSLIDGG
jgi:hypothetical protein